MANKNFKVRHGLDIGDSVSITDAGAASGFTSLAITTLDATNVDVTNIRALDGTAAASIANTTGVITVSSQLNVDNISISGNDIFNNTGDINLITAGTADVNLIADTVQVGDANATATITTNGTGNLVLNTNAGTNAGTLTLANGAFTSTGSSISGTTLTIGTLSTGTIQVGQSIHGGTVLTNTVITANISGTGSGSTWTVSKSQTVASSSLTGSGNITLAPNTTGDIALTLNNGGNLINNRNYVFGEIRNATTESIGDIWALNSTGPVQPFRGVSIDNSVDTLKNAGYVARNYGNVAANRARFIFERARFTGTPATPAAVQAGDFLGELAVTGYTSTGWINDNITAAVPGFFGFQAIENWVSNTNLGTTFSLSMAPTATTITTGGNNVQTIGSNPQALALRADIFSIAQGKTTAFTATGSSVSGTTLTIGTLVSGTIAVGQQVQSTTNAFLNGTYIVANISGSGSGSTWTLSASQTTAGSLAVAGNTGFIGSPSSGGSVDALANLRLLRNTIQGSGGTTQIVTSSAGATLELRGDNIQLENAAGSALTSAGVSYTRTYGEFAYTAATVTIAAQDTVYAFPLDTTLASSGTSISNTSRVNINVAGYYKIIMSLQCAMETNSVGQFDFWLRKNGVDVANSATQVDLLKDQKAVISMDWLVESDGNDYWEIMYASNSANYANLDFPFIPAWTTPTNPYARPAAPVILVNVIPAGM